MKEIKKYLMMIIISVFFLIPVQGYAQTAHTGDQFERCSKTGVGTGTIFLPTDTNPVTLTIANLDSNYIYYGIDVGIFHKISGTDWQNIFPIDREITNKTIVNIASFGTMGSYNYDDVYMVSYRIIYRTSQGQLIETDWQPSESNCFKVHPFQPEISEFTDRVTGANNWMTDEQAAALNEYAPNSEIVARITIDPKDSSVKSYKLDIDTNTDNDKIKIDYVRVVKIIYQDSNGNEVYSNSNEHPPIAERLNTNTIDSFMIDAPAPGQYKVSIYVKYHFQKVDENYSLHGNNKDKFTSKVTVTSTSEDGTCTAVDEMTNQIKIRDINIYYR